MTDAAPPAARLRPTWILETLRSWGAVVFLGVAPAALMGMLTTLVVLAGRGGPDFATFWHSGRLVLHGTSPYPDVQSLPAVADRTTFAPFVYPPSAAFAMVPLSILPFAVASALFLLVGLGCVVLSLRLLGVRDWRCYGAAFLSAPVYAAAGNGTVSLLLLLAVAAAWRYRDRPLVLGTAVAALIAVKLFLWPLWLWLVCTRRFGAAALSAAMVVASTIGSWALIGFAGLHDYPHLLARLTQLVGPEGYSLYALERAGGASDAAAQIGLVVAGLLLVGFIRGAFSGEGGDTRLFAAAIGGSLLMTPILWPHYLVLLFVPIAIARRTLSGLWLLPLAYWLDGATWSDGRPELIAPVLGLSAVVVAVALRQPGATRPHVHPLARRASASPAR